jgi:hypothetical protein
VLIRAIIKAFIKNHRDTADASVREAYGVLSGVLGILCNLVLFITKLAVGLFIDSIAVVSDATTDKGSVTVMVINVKDDNVKYIEACWKGSFPFGSGHPQYFEKVCQVSFSKWSLSCSDRWFRNTFSVNTPAVSSFPDSR